MYFNYSHKTRNTCRIYRSSQKILKCYAWTASNMASGMKNLYQISRKNIYCRNNWNYNLKPLELNRLISSFIVILEDKEEKFMKNLVIKINEK